MMFIGGSLMKKRWLAIALTIVMTVSAMIPSSVVRAENEGAEGQAAVTLQSSAADIPSEYKNQLHNYVPGVFGTCRTSFMEALSDGGYRTVVYDDGVLYVNDLNQEGNVVMSKEISLELPIWGGIFLGKYNNYVVCGQAYDSDKEDGGEVYRIIRYDKKFNRVNSLSLSGKETYTARPFDAGNVSIDENEGELTVYTSRNRLDGHQSNIAIQINTEDMSIKNTYGIGAFPDVHVSHSLRQIFQYDDGKPVYVDLSDAYPRRSVFIQSDSLKTSVLDISGEVGNNVTNAEVSGLATSETSYLVTGCYLRRNMSNVFLACVDKETGEVTRKWLTNSTAFQPKYVHNPRIVKVSADKFVVMWGTTSCGGEVTAYVIVNENGDFISELKQEKAMISDCQPIFDGTSVVWLAANNGGLTLQRISDFTKNGASYTEPSEEIKEATNPWDGTADTSWYDGEKKEYDISTPEQLAGLAELVNNGNTFEGIKVNLTTDILLNDTDYRYEWDSIAKNTSENSDSGNVFQGTFDGKGHTIYNLYKGEKEEEDGGLFGCIGEHGMVKAVNVSQGYSNTGGCIARINDGVIIFCNNYSSCGSYDSKVGGICDYNYNLVYGCKNYGEVWGESVGGIVGSNRKTLAVVSQCGNEGMVEGTHDAAGIVNMNYGWIYNCYNKGTIGDSYPGNINRGRCVCGIVYDNVGKSAVENCYSVGTFSYNEDTWMGAYAIVREDSDKKVSNCYAVPSDASDFRTNLISYEEMLSDDFLKQLDNQQRNVFSAWKKDSKGMNQGLPITVADDNRAAGKYKLQPELWTGTSDISMNLGDGDKKLSFECYYNESEPVITVDDTDIVQVIYDGSSWKMKPLKSGTTQIRFHFDETENTVSADFTRNIIVISDSSGDNYENPINPTPPSDPITPSNPTPPSDPITPSNPITPSGPITPDEPATPANPSGETTTGETTGGSANSGNNHGNTESTHTGKPVKGDKLEIGNNTYTIINSKTKEIAYTKTVSKSSTIKIPAAVKLDGVTYKVTKISNNAFKNNKFVTKIVLGNNITEIGENAFQGCSRLKTITITSKVKEIGSNAFSGDKKLTTLQIASSKLTSKGVKNSLKGSYIKTIQLSGSARKMYKEYGKYFKKSNSGKSVKIKK